MKPSLQSTPPMEELPVLRHVESVKTRKPCWAMRDNPGISVLVPPGEEEDPPACLPALQEEKGWQWRRGLCCSLSLLQVPVFSQMEIFQQASHLQGLWVTLQPQPASYCVMFPVTSLINWVSNRLEDAATEDKTGKIQFRVNQNWCSGAFVSPKEFLDLKQKKLFHFQVTS